jgi:EmrB/QacA subfamily drug resistance transporter
MKNATQKTYDQGTLNLILAVAALSGFVAAFMANSLNVALKEIGEEFHLSAVVLDWIPLTYALAAGAILMPAGRIADIFGRMKVFIIGLVCFTAFGLASGFAPSGAALIALRTAQGLAASLLFATNIALVTLSQPPEKRGRALGILTAGVYMGTTLGPVLGGLITNDLGWRAIFLIAGGVSLVIAALSIWKLHGIDYKEPKRAHFDVSGSVVWIVAFPALVLGLTFLPGLTGILLVAGGALGIILFMWWETRAADPILNVDLFRRNRVFAFSNAAALINYSATFAMAFLMSLYLRYNLHEGPRTVGYVLVSGTLLQALVSPIAGRLADRFQPRLVAASGMSLCVVGLLAFAFLGEHTSYWYIIPALCVLGIGFGLFASPIAYLVMSSVDKRYIGTGSATVATMRVAGQGLSMGIAGLILATVVGRHEIDAQSPIDLANLLTSVRLSFAIFAGLCVLGIVAVLVGGPRPAQTDPAQAAPAPTDSAPE